MENINFISSFPSSHKLRKEDLLQVLVNHGISNIPVEYQDFILQSNGGYADRCGVKLKENIYNLSVFFGVLVESKIFSLNYAIETFSERLPENSLPIARDVSGNIFFINCANIYFWFHDLDDEDTQSGSWENIETIAEDFSTFLDMLIEIKPVERNRDELDVLCSMRDLDQFEKTLQRFNLMEIGENLVSRCVINEDLDKINYLVGVGVGLNKAVAVAIGNHLEDIAILLIGNIEKKMMRNEAGNTWLHLAVRWGCPKVVSYLIERSVDLDDVDARGYSALALAANDQEKNELYKMLKDAGAIEIYPSWKS